MNVNELKSNYSIFGNKGNVWNNTAHIYKSGEGNLCGTPALSTNWARIENVETIGCVECLKKYNETNYEIFDIDTQYNTEVYYGDDDYDFGYDEWKQQSR